ncbi:MAG TPA: SAM-dependent methyltransferase [Xanthobacteraceae bacterium]|nr:SAM-dependent methyltransferase [Xanthobacteraceae bacterium]
MTPLETEIRRMIAADGPMPLGRFMTLCLAHPVHGYYMSRDPLGVAGDFVTAPEVSQMFGELVGLWAAAVWQQMGAPRHIRLVELGPGRGTMMSDALRGVRVLPAFRHALSVDLIEISPVLRRRQEQTLADLDVPIAWHSDVADLGDGPLIVIANEFIDALPVDQLVRTADGWHARMIGFDAAGGLAFALHPDALLCADSIVPPQVRDAPIGSVYEWRSGCLITGLAERIVRDGGAGLMIDYGHTQPAVGETLQSVRSHRPVPVLEDPGDVDLTAHVDFAALGRAAERAAARLHGPISQADLLRRLGIDARAARLKTAATYDQAIGIDAALARLAGSGPAQMGGLFKAIAFAPPELGPLPGFDG